MLFVKISIFFQFSSIYSPHYASMDTNKSINTLFGKKKQQKTNKQHNIPSAHKHTATGMATNRPRILK